MFVEFSAHCLTMLYHCTKFCENILSGSNLKSRKIFIPIVTKTHYPIKMYVGLQVLFYAHCLMMLYIYTKFRENIFNYLKVIEQTISILITTKGKNSVKIYVELHFFFSAHHLITDNALHSKQVSRKYFEQFQNYGADTICDGQSDRWTDRQLWEKKCLPERE